MTNGSYSILTVTTFFLASFEDVVLTTITVSPSGLRASFGDMSDRRDLAENLALRVEPIIDRIPMPPASLTVELIGPFGDQDMQVIAG